MSSGSSNRPPQRTPQPGGGSKVRITSRGWLVLAVVVVALLGLGGWAFVWGNDDGPLSPTGQAAGTSPASSGGGITTPPTTDEATSTGAPALPACEYSVLPAPEVKLGQWERTLLDTTFALPDTYMPPDLVQVAEAGFESQELVRSFVIPDLEALRTASEQAGNPVDVLVAYRSFLRQQALFQEHVRDLGRKEALAKTARPGHSEHQLGTTVDFRTKGQLDVDEDWESEPTGAWMAANAWKFGFLMSYPRDRVDVTCYSYEPWHYRYFGRALAAKIHESGLTPREYLWELDSRDAASKTKGTSAP